MMHRAYHAMPDLSKNGVKVNAVYGFFSMLINVLVDQKPTHLAIAFDRSKPTIRQSMYAGYHQHRPPMDEGLSPQFKLTDALLETLKAPTFSLDGYEGDDMIGTIATRVANTSDERVLILTGDRDMLQLVTDRIHVLMPIVGLTKSMEFNEAAVEEKYGVKPSQFIDYKALIGDQSDGYPGVTGIGPKTAASLLKQYQTFESLYERIGELPEKVGTKLALDAEQAALAKKLATIITDAPMQLDISLCEVRKFDLMALRSEFETLGFNSLIVRLDAKFPEIKEALEKKAKADDGQMELL